MLDLFNIAKPQGCDIQTFYGAGPYGNTTEFAWTKPRGVSHVYMMLIGGGGDGDGAGTGGGSGAVTVWYGAAQHVPDSLLAIPWTVQGGSPTTVKAKFTSATPVTLLSAESGAGTVGGIAMAANQFTASGFFQSVAGQDGQGGSTPAPSATTFLTGGTQRTVTANYGYTNNQTTADGFFQLQPIIVGVAASSTSAATRKAGIGCGGAGIGTARPGGSGMVLIASW